MSNDTEPQHKQMSGEMFSSAPNDVFSRAATPIRNRLAKTPFTALAIDQQMLKALLEKVRPVYTETKSHMIPLCWYGHGLEPPSAQPKAKALAAIDDRNGLQIILCSVDGKYIGKDGIPYHMIWSYDSSFIEDYPVLDKDYTWPVVEMKEKISRDAKGHITVAFEEAHRTDMRYPRVLGNIEKRAEELALLALRDNVLFSRTRFKTADFDYFGLYEPLDIPSPNKTCFKTPDVMRIDHDTNNMRLACPGVWQ